MEPEKENTNMIKVKSKIPLPVAPLPSLPKCILKKDVEYERRPLKAINQESINQCNVAGASKIESVDNIGHKCSLKIDTQHVTIRKKVDELDWNYSVFKDNSGDFPGFSEDEEILGKNGALRYFDENNVKNCLGKSKKAVTPAFKSSGLEPNRVKNIKRSLKRPHSRELQGISPLSKQEKGEEKYKRRLEFKDCLLDRLQPPDSLKKSYMACLSRDYTDDLFTYLLNSEHTSPRPKISSIARSCVINWLMKVNGIDGNPAIVQSARWYLDSILAVTHLHIDQLQLVAASCYWIAQKLYGPPITAKKLVRCSSQAFTSSRLQAAEKAVLHKLKFPKTPIVPQEYINYLAWCCDSSHPGEIEVAAGFICMAGMLVDKSLSVQYPSVIAIAAVRNALLLLKKRDLMIKLQMNPIFHAAEKKSSNLPFVCTMQRKAIRLMGSPLYEYKAPLEIYNVAPCYIAQKIVSSSNDLAEFDTRINPCQSK